MAITKVSASLVDLDGGVVINESSADADFRVESNDKTHMLFVDSGNNKVGINSSSPQTTFVVQHTDGGIGIEFSMGDPVSFIQCYNRTSNDYASLSIDAEDIRFRTNDSTERMRITSAGKVGIGMTSPNATLNVNGTIRAENERFLAGREDASAPAYSFHDDADTGMFNIASNILSFSTAGSETMRLTSAGLLQLGTAIGNSTYAGLFNGVSNVGTGAIIQTRNGDGKKHFMLRGDNNVEYGSIGLSSATGSGALQLQGEDTIVFNTNTDTERMRINSSGKVLIGTTSGVRGQEDLSIDAGSDAIVTRTAGAGLIVRKSSFGNGFLCLFENDSATAVGSITSGGSSTVYNTSSDYRLKENIETMQNGLERLNKLNPVKFTWKETGEEAEGFIAHEVDEIFSDCVYGEKDGNEMQGVDYGRITPLLVKAVQELTAEVEELKTKLESK